MKHWQSVEITERLFEENLLNRRQSDFREETTTAELKKTPPCSTSEEPIWTFHTLLTLVCSVSSIWTYLISTEFSCCFCVCLGSVVIDPLNLYPLQYYCISRLHCFNFSSCRTSKPSRTPVVCKVLNLSVYMCMYACYLYLCERQRDDVQETIHTHTHTHTPLLKGDFI